MVSGQPGPGGTHMYPLRAISHFVEIHGAQRPCTKTVIK